MKDTQRKSYTIPVIPALAVIGMICLPLKDINDSFAWDLLKSTSTATLNAETATTLQQMLEQESTTTTTAFDYAALKSFYAARNWQPAWVDGDALSPKAKNAIEKIVAASEDGLNPQHYGLRSIERTQETNNDTPSTHSRAMLELLVSHAILAYASDIGYGATPRQNKVRIEGFTHEPATAQLLQRADDSRDIRDYLTSLSPNSGQYQSLKNLLAKYRLLASNGGWPTFEEGKTIKPGMKDARIVSLRAILTMTGDLTADTTAYTSDATDTLFSDGLVAAVKRFQTRHGLEADGVMGASTQAALAVPTTARIDQIVATMERMRWLPTQLGNRYVMVNVPSFSLVGYADGKAQLNMRVITGERRNPTPLFSNEVREVSFNPTWGVPYRIAAKEMLPKIQNDPEYLVRAGYRVTDSDGEVVDPLSVDWDQVSSSNFGYRLRQQAGRGNALGKIKFMLPENENIYLHDTSTPKLFAKAERALSHGCIRLENPRAMAHFVLEAQEGWTAEKVDKFYDGSDTRTVRIEPVPVHMTYYTAYVDESSDTPYFFDDVYGLDHKVTAAISRTVNDIQLAQN